MGDNQVGGNQAQQHATAYCQYMEVYGKTCPFLERYSFMLHPLFYKKKVLALLKA